MIVSSFFGIVIFCVNVHERYIAFVVSPEINDSEIAFLFQSHLAVTPFKGEIRVQ